MKTYIQNPERIRTNNIGCGNTRPMGCNTDTGNRQPS